MQEKSLCGADRTKKLSSVMILKYTISICYVSCPRNTRAYFWGRTLAILRHMALNLIKKEETKGSNRVKFKRAGWNDDFLIKLLAQN